ncbi:MAG: response regulator [Anaerolineae bacterium]|nr:response regulator [Anaerolineae bacterium]
MPSILIVEDDQTSVKLLKILLEEVHGFGVALARHGADVVPMASENPPDIFLIDYHLSDMDGLTLIGTLRASPLFEKTPIVMASGLDVEIEALKAGASAFLVKPYEPDELANLFKTLTSSSAS